MNPKELATIVFHPIEALRVRRWQILVSLEHASPPPNTFIEDFESLPLAMAMNRVWAAEKKGKIREKGYSESDADRLLDGKLPQGYPRDPRM